MAKFKECAKVVSQERIGTGIFSLWLQTEQVAGEAKPGQFINLYCQDGSRLLPRPISICEVNKEERQLRIVYRVAGKGTAEFSSYSKGDEVEILGPLGNGFPLDRMEEGKKAVVIFGGGIPLKVDGRIIGGLGISGGTGEEDHSLAEYGLSVLPEIL